MTDRKIHIEAVGTGPPIVFTAGWLNDLSVWDGVVAALEDSARCIRWDLPGQGRSSAPGKGQYTRDLVLADLHRVIELEGGGQPPVLVGHSFGGYLSLAYAIEHSDTVRALGLVAAGPGFRSPESMDRWNESVRRTASTRDLPDGQEELSMHFDSMVIDHLGEISVPVSVVVGERDAGFLPSAAVFEKHLPVMASTVVSGAGHMVHAKYPEDVAAAIRPLLTTTPPPTPDIDVAE